MDNLFRHFVQELNKRSLNNIKSIEKKTNFIFDFKIIILTFAFDSLSLVLMISKTDIIDAINLSGRILKKKISSYKNKIFGHGNYLIISSHLIVSVSSLEFSFCLSLPTKSCTA